MAYDNFTSRGGGSWDDAHEDDDNRLNLGFGQPKPTVLSLGQVIDGYLHLSDSDKAIFAAACLQGRLPANAGSANPAVQTAVGPGQTMDPKTGKVFKITPKREHTAARKSCENALATAKRQFSEYLRTQNLTLDEDKQLPQGASDDQRRRAIALYRAVETAKQSLADYKSTHPEEFLPPPNKKAGLTSRDVMQGKAPTPKGSVSPPTGGVTQPQGRVATPPKGGVVVPATAGTSPTRQLAPTGAQAPARSGNGPSRTAGGLVKGQPST